MIVHIIDRYFQKIVLRCFCLLAMCCMPPMLFGQDISGEMKVWHKVTLTFDGPLLNEQSDPNPFADYRMTVTFTHDSTAYVVPGYFTADGNAANTQADAGNRWRVHFAPDREGEWSYAVSFRQGLDIAISEDEGIAVEPDGMTGTISIMPSDKTGRDFRGKGRLAYVYKRYLQHLGSGEFFLKTGADSPETFLACEDFDQTYLLSSGAALKSWSPHRGDWEAGDPVWRDSLGKGIIGAINYLASEEQNAISFLTMNIQGDGDNVWPYADPAQFDRFDCSKLDQWEILFEHCDRKGIYLHFKMQEQENDQLLDGGELGRMRKLYYRELIARFGHHLALNWNLGEENSNSDAQRKAFAQYFFDHDPYHHNIVVHTFPGSDDFVYIPLLGNQSRLTGASLQTDWDHVHGLTREWVQRSEEAMKPWIVANDEQGIAFIGVPHDAFLSTPSQGDIRAQVLWGNLMAGGAGVEYYFGYALPHNDLNCEDFRSRDRMWDYNRYATHFFKTYLPYWSMDSADSLVSGHGDPFCFSLEDSVYVVYLPGGGDATLDLSAATGIFNVEWYDPRNSGELISGPDTVIAAGGIRPLGAPPSSPTADWVVLLRHEYDVPDLPVLDCAPFGCDSVVLYWKHNSNLGSLMIEISPDSVLFQTIDTGESLHCADLCSVRLPVRGLHTYIRLRVDGTPFYSNTVGCHVPCYGPGEIHENIDHIKIPRQHR